MSIGAISLNLSFIIYLIWFTPQITLNFKRKTTQGLSLCMHSILCIGYLCDLMYGFGRDMQWQYRTVSIVGLISLSIQHFQVAYYGLPSQKEKWMYFGFNIIFIVLFIMSICVIQFSHFDKNIFDLLGMCTNTCWLIYGIPQIIKNYNKQSTTGLSTLFICFAIFLNLCDLTSAWALNWDYPSKIGPILSFTQNIILISQIIYYRKRQQKYPLINEMAYKVN